eukprot:4056634-Amphidinium_carterae.1
MEDIGQQRCMRQCAEPSVFLIQHWKDSVPAKAIPATPATKARKLKEAQRSRIQQRATAT